MSVRFTPCRDGHVSFRMVLKVKGKTEPLAIAVKADCFAMTASLQVSMPGTDLRDVNPNHPDTLDFGKVGNLTSHCAPQSHEHCVNAFVVTFAQCAPPAGGDRGESRLLLRAHQHGAVQPGGEFGGDRPLRAAAVLGGDAKESHHRRWDAAAVVTFVLSQKCLQSAEHRTEH